MMHEDNIASQSEPQQQDYFLRTLLDEKNCCRPFYPPSTEKHIKECPSNPNPDYDNQCNDDSPLRLLEVLVWLPQKEDCNYLLPERPYLEQPEDDVLLLPEGNKKNQEQISHSVKKQGRIDKLAYQQESRAVKIQRYRDKKSRRKWDRKVFYDCRKVVADSRERVNGRFVKKSPFVRPIDPFPKSSPTGDIQLQRQTLQSNCYEVQQLFL